MVFPNILKQNHAILWFLIINLVYMYIYVSHFSLFTSYLVYMYNILKLSTFYFVYMNYFFHSLQFTLLTCITFFTLPILPCLHVSHFSLSPIYLVYMCHIFHSPHFADIDSFQKLYRTSPQDFLMGHIHMLYSQMLWGCMH